MASTCFLMRWLIYINFLLLLYGKITVQNGGYLYLCYQNKNLFTCSSPEQHSGRLYWSLLSLASANVKVLCYILRTSIFPNHVMDLVHVWYDDRYWSKILCSTIPTPIHDRRKFKVTDLEFLYLMFTLKILGPEGLWYEPRQANLCLRAFRHDKL